MVSCSSQSYDVVQWSSSNQEEKCARYDTAAWTSIINIEGLQYEPIDLLYSTKDC